MSESVNSLPALLRLPTVMERTGLRRSTIYELVQKGAFPAPVNLGPRTVAWPSNEVDTWIVQRLAGPRPLARKAAA
jgi:prophage regulatory protein